jgi:hypothetical protein
MKIYKAILLLGLFSKIDFDCFMLYWLCFLNRIMLHPSIYLQIALIGFCLQGTGKCNIEESNKNMSLFLHVILEKSWEKLRLAIQLVY